VCACVCMCVYLYVCRNVHVHAATYVWACVCVCVHLCLHVYKLEKLNVQAGKRDKILLAHAQRTCEAHDTGMRSYYQQIHGSSGADATTSMENIGEQEYV